jgi:hypothetical protein
MHTSLTALLSIVSIFIILIFCEPTIFPEGTVGNKTNPNPTQYEQQQTTSQGTKLCLSQWAEAVCEHYVIIPGHWLAVITRDVYVHICVVYVTCVCGYEVAEKLQLSNTAAGVMYSKGGNARGKTKQQKQNE